ncbi:sensor histidine kinase [Nocardioides rotundus]|uniref:sensor histidine kinase n=1 Tax=Nocardioides rotundus TaxID=1774216 RepID=UPI001CBDC3E4|nr:histidine kinase [Nocardioides rotundus]
MLLISLFIWLLWLPSQWAELRWLVLFDPVIGAVAFTLVRYRRRWPMTIAVLTNLLNSVSATSTGPSVLATVSLAARRVTWQVVTIGFVVAGCVGTYYVLQPSSYDSPWWVIVLMTAAAVVIELGWGLFIGSRRELIWMLTVRAERAEAERDERLARARADERNRVAREAHDAVAHRITQVSMHAGAMAFREDLDPAQMRTSAEQIQRAANEALIDLRAVLGALGNDPSPEADPDDPQPTYADVPRLVDQARAEGARVDFIDAVTSPETMPPQVGRTVYRICQEGMRNAAQHAPGTLLTIRVSGEPREGVHLALTNPLGFRQQHPAGPGLGLVGLTERAELRGGTLFHQARDGFFRLKGWLPWTA